MALGHCRHRIHSLGWSIVMFFLIYWACIDEPWVSLVTRVQSAIKKRSNLLKNVSFTQAGLHSWAAAALPPSIINTPPAWQMGRAAAGFVPHSFRPLPPTPPDSDAGRRQAHSGCHSRLGERPDLAERLTDSWLLGAMGKKKASLWSCPLVVAGTTLPVATTSTLGRGHVGRAGGWGGLRFHSGPGLHLSGLSACTPPPQHVHLAAPRIRKLGPSSRGAPRSLLIHALLDDRKRTFPDQPPEPVCWLEIRSLLSGGPPLSLQFRCVSVSFQACFQQIPALLWTLRQPDPLWGSEQKRCLCVCVCVWVCVCVKAIVAPLAYILSGSVVLVLVTKKTWMTSPGSRCRRVCISFWKPWQYSGLWHEFPGPAWALGVQFMTTGGQKAPWPACVSAPRLRVHQQARQTNQPEKQTWEQTACTRSVTSIPSHSLCPM